MRLGAMEMAFVVVVVVVVVVVAVVAVVAVVVVVVSSDTSSPFPGDARNVPLHDEVDGNETPHSSPLPRHSSLDDTDHGEHSTRVGDPL
jgi:hypothetical protein